MRRNVFIRLLMIRPLFIALLPRRDMLQYQVRTYLQRLGTRHMSTQPVCPCGIVYSDKALPLLDREWFRGVDAETHSLALRVEGVEVDVSDYAEGRLRAEGFELVELLVCEAGFGDAAGGCEGERGGGEEGGWRGHFKGRRGLWHHGARCRMRGERVETCYEECLVRWWVLGLRLGSQSRLPDIPCMRVIHLHNRAIPVREPSIAPTAHALTLTVCSKLFQRGS
ncbi:hypothetical protein K458DRAFT_78273 [Lentithecium fluviatile CBS 122367]|uniref:Uncharacterized protein n=1 Tax=Lentithecium fluviatile CBS 122367 TaxID=1168545 RepID=A0A6G1IU15_9PLEO|nr:hypothetical protein K458DRAFT_78273 [Lentithecium fluviatile CBS 122367]